GVAPVEVREGLAVQDAGDPLPERESSLPPELEERLEVSDRVPEPHLQGVRLQQRLGTAHQAGVDEGGEVEPAPGHQAVRGAEPCIALDELQLAVAVIALELGVGEAAQ